MMGPPEREKELESMKKIGDILREHTGQPDIQAFICYFPRLPATESPDARSMVLFGPDGATEEERDGILKTAGAALQQHAVLRGMFVHIEMVSRAEGLALIESQSEGVTKQ